MPSAKRQSSAGFAGTTGLYEVNSHIRLLHIIEAKRIMGFDDDHCLSEGTQGYKQMGNSVIPKMIRLVYNGISER